MFIFDTTSIVWKVCVHVDLLIENNYSSELGNEEIVTGG